MHHPNLVDLPDPGGSPRRFEPNSAQTYQLLAVGLMLLTTGVAAYWYWRQGELQGKLGALPFLLLPVGIVVIGSQLWKLVRPLRVDLTPAGFAIGGEECWWDEVVAVREQLNPGSPLNGLVVRVRRADGWTARLSACRLAELPRLLAIIHGHTYERLAAEARAAVGRGEDVSFGPVELGTAGLRSRGRELTWDELEGVWPDEHGDLVFRAIGRRGAWLDVPTGTVDNVRVLLQLVEELAPNQRPVR